MLSFGGELEFDCPKCKEVVCIYTDIIEEEFNGEIYLWNKDVVIEKGNGREIRKIKFNKIPQKELINYPIECDCGHIIFIKIWEDPQSIKKGRKAKGKRGKYDRKEKDRKEL